MKCDKTLTIEQIAQQAAAVEVAVREAVRQTLIDHKRSGDPVVFCDNGNVRWVPAEEIEIPPASDESELR